MKDGAGNNQDWLIRYKKKIIIAIVSIITAAVALTMVLIAWTLRSQLMAESRMRAQELGVLIHSSLNHLMQVRDPDRMQTTLEAIGRENPSLVRTFILDDHGKVAYSTDRNDIGTVIDRFTHVSCKGCHSGPVVVPHDKSMIITVDGKRVQRYVHVIENQPNCHGCHPASTRINGKLIIDRSLEPTDALIKTVVTIISGLGVLCMVVLVPFLWRVLSRGVNTYITEIRLKSTELITLYGIVERLSATIDLEELKRIIIDIISDAFGADEIDMVMPNEYREMGAIAWTKTGKNMSRKKVDPASDLHGVIQSWLEGRANEPSVCQAGKGICMPVAKAGNRLALIVIRIKEPAFNQNQLPLIRAMANHIAVAFDNAMLYQMAITDELTGLYSHRYFRQAISKRHALFEEYGEKMTLLMVDIDNFKRINDTYGHPTGDVILKETGKCILSAVRTDDMAFRYGGEEFTVILPGTDPSAGKAVAERVRTLIEHFPFKVDQHMLNLTVSIGVASWPASAETIRDIILEADKALYEAKNGGKNRVVLRTPRDDR